MCDRTSPAVLIVEDEWLVRMELVDAFDALGFSVIESASAEHALEVLETASDIVLLVTDIRLTGPLDGWSLAIEARAMIPSLAVVYLSANPPALDRIVEGGIFLDKPALMETVTRTAVRLLETEG